MSSFRTFVSMHPAGCTPGDHGQPLFSTSMQYVKSYVKQGMRVMPPDKCPQTSVEPLKVQVTTKFLLNMFFGNTLLCRVVDVVVSFFRRQSAIIPPSKVCRVPYNRHRLRFQVVDIILLRMFLMCICVLILIQVPSLQGEERICIGA